MEKKWWCETAVFPWLVSCLSTAPSGSDEEARLVSSGAMKLPQQEMDWKLFFLSRPKGNVPRKVAVDAAVQSRGDR